MLCLVDQLFEASQNESMGNQKSRRKLKYRPDMETRILSECAGCKHKHSGKIGCDAYPDGIPWVILIGEVMHREPYEGDRGIQFEPEDQGAE